MNKTRPIKIFWQSGVTRKQINYVIKVARKVLRFAGMDKEIAVKLGGNISKKIALSRDIKFGSKFFGQYDAGKILDDISRDQELDKHNKYYTIFLLKDGMFLSVKNKKKSVGGLAMSDDGFVMEIGDNSLRGRNRVPKYWAHNIVMHELGHVFGLPSGKRKKRIKLSSINRTRHCANDCVMNPDIKTFKFCPDCRRELREYFKEI